MSVLATGKTGCLGSYMALALGDAGDRGRGRNVRRGARLGALHGELDLVVASALDWETRRPRREAA